MKSVVERDRGRGRERKKERERGRERVKREERIYAYEYIICRLDMNIKHLQLLEKYVDGPGQPC